MGEPLELSLFKFNFIPAVVICCRSISGKSSNVEQVEQVEESRMVGSGLQLVMQLIGENHSGSIQAKEVEMETEQECRSLHDQK